MKHLLRVVFTLCAVPLFLLSCAATSVGSIVLDQVPMKIEIKENSPGSIPMKGMDITINGEFIGTALMLNIERDGFSSLATSFSPVQSKFGEIKIVQNVSSSPFVLNVDFDVTVDGAYVGNVKQASAI